MIYDRSVLLLLVLGCTVAYLMWDTYVDGKVEKVKASDGKEYQVQSLPDKEEAANLLAEIKRRLITLRDHMVKMYPDDPMVQRLVKNFRPDNIVETATNSKKYTSYSINKGEKILLCLRSRDNKNELADINTMMFVAIHELAHVACASTGHTEEFWDIFRTLLVEAINIGVYVKQDYRKKPQPYCGMEITDSPVF